MDVSERYGEARGIVRATYLLAMGREPIFVGIDGHGVHCELMGSPEHPDGDFLEESCRIASSQVKSSRSDSKPDASKVDAITTYTSVSDENLCERAAVTCGFSSHGMDGVDGSDGETGSRGSRCRRNW